MKRWIPTFAPVLAMLSSSTASATNLADFQPVAGPTTVDLGTISQHRTSAPTTTSSMRPTPRS